VTAKKGGVATVTIKHEGISGEMNITVDDLAPLPGPTVQSISISGNTTIDAGQSTQLTATAAMSDGSSQNVTTTAAWSTSNPTIAVVSRGLVTGLAVGTVTISANQGGKTAQVNVVVQNGGGPPPQTVQSLSISGDTSLLVNETSQLTATANMSDATSQNVTVGATWTSSDPNIASVSSSGVVTAKTAGMTTISASYLGKTAQAQVSVEAPLPSPLPPTIVDLDVTGGVNLCPIAPGATVQLHAIATYSDGTKKDVTAQAAWSTSNPLVTNLSPDGLLKVTGTGGTDVQASFEGRTVKQHLNVCLEIPQVGTVTIDGDGKVSVADLLLGDGLQLNANQNMTDGTTVDCTKSANWTSSNPLINVLDGQLKGLLGLAAGSTTIKAECGGKTGSKVITITPF
jgi:uncharacterized protein YjdB